MESRALKGFLYSVWPQPGPKTLRKGEGGGPCLDQSEMTYGLTVRVTLLFVRGVHSHLFLLPHANPAFLPSSHQIQVLKSVTNNKGSFLETSSSLCVWPGEQGHAGAALHPAQANSSPRPLHTRCAPDSALRQACLRHVQGAENAQSTRSHHLGHFPIRTDNEH